MQFEEIDWDWKNLVNRENISGKVKDWDYSVYSYRSKTWVWRCRLKSHLQSANRGVMSDIVKEKRIKMEVGQRLKSIISGCTK